MTTFFCRALYDYNPEDTSSLAFVKDEIIEVLTTLSSGWWDGYLREERGWFPSNYVTVISDEEAELALADDQILDPDNSFSTITQANGSYSTAQELNQQNDLWSGGDWAVGGIGSENGLTQLANATLEEENNGQSSDFWVPQVTSDGQV